VKRERGNLPRNGRTPTRNEKGRRILLSATLSPTYFIGLEEANPNRERSSGVKRETTMAWTTPTLVEICIGLEINGYLPAEF
jgi:coenzyme PQQ precursor peptide PqqA